jgi:death-on-curing protein
MADLLYLTADQILALHREALTLGGLDGIRSEHGLASAVFQPQQSVFGQDAYPTVADKAAAYAFFIAENQPFIDGNKRTAALAMLVFLDLNGYDLIEPESESLAVVLEELGSREMSQDAFFRWVSDHARPQGLSGIRIVV